MKQIQTLVTREKELRAEALRMRKELLDLAAKFDETLLSKTLTHTTAASGQSVVSISSVALEREHAIGSSSSSKVLAGDGGCCGDGNSSATGSVGGADGGSSIDGGSTSSGLGGSSSTIASTSSASGGVVTTAPSPSERADNSASRRSTAGEIEHPLQL